MTKEENSDDVEDPISNEDGDEAQSYSEEPGEDGSNPEDDEEDEEVVKPKKKKKIHKLTLTETENFNEKLRRRGVIYIARIPPRMTPTKIKSLLSDFGEVTRVYLVEEDATVRKRRKKEYGSSGGKRYIEGWVEFASKRKAKHVARSLNNTPISNQKRNPHYGKRKRSNYLNFTCETLHQCWLSSFLLYR
jgi:ESF2/ABP1 family protein